MNQRQMKLAIISHTRHYRLSDGTIVSLGHTAREINHLLEIFDEIIHLAPLLDGVPPVNVIPYTSDRIRLVPLKDVGGVSLLQKLRIIYLAPANLLTIFRTIRHWPDWVQFRAPTSMGLYVMPLLSCMRKPKRWVKYAGNWQQPNAPLSYRIQRYMVRRNWLRCRATINGSWPNQAPHLISFLNPCLTEEELTMAAEAASNRRFDRGLNVCFVGRLEEAKGPAILLEALKSMEHPMVSKVTLVGAGPQEKALRELAHDCAFDVVFTGELKRTDLNAVYASHHVFVLPSKSEGFPKVVAEAASFGCIPVVTDMSGIGQIIKHGENGYLLSHRSVSGLTALWRELAGSSPEELAEMSRLSSNLAALFSYRTYNKRLQESILSVQ